MDVVVERCAGLDVHKDTVVACVRVPAPGGVRPVRSARSLWIFWRRGTWLLADGVTLLGMERSWSPPSTCWPAACPTRTWAVTTTSSTTARPPRPQEFQRPQGHRLDRHREPRQLTCRPPRAA